MTLDDAIPVDVLADLHQGRVPSIPLTIDMADRILSLMKIGVLPYPKEKALWSWSDEEGSITLAFMALMRKALPPNYAFWDVARNGVPLAFDYFWEYHHVPKGFSDWELSTPTKWTVAHMAASHGHLPPDFDQWHLVDNYGRTVAHVAAENGSIPPFDQWFLTDAQGRTVADVALESGVVDQARYEQILLEHEQAARGRSAASLTMSF